MLYRGDSTNTDNDPDFVEIFNENESAAEEGLKFNADN